ncbi:MAG: hypothetical protein FWG15_06615 [Propionibacteriaceae bacterium]|nr:hypothetical protein [Propionibacteriaceae bacterium]
MKSFYLDRAKQLVESTYQEFSLQVSLDGWTSDLPGDISQEDFQMWAQDNLTVKAVVILPYDGTASEETLRAESAPIETGLASLGGQASNVTLKYYSYDGFAVEQQRFNNEQALLNDHGDVLLTYNWTK